MYTKSIGSLGEAYWWCESYCKFIIPLQAVVVYTMFITEQDFVPFTLHIWKDVKDISHHMSINIDLYYDDRILRNRNKCKMYVITAHKH